MDYKNYRGDDTKFIDFLNNHANLIHFLRFIGIGLAILGTLLVFLMVTTFLPTNWTLSIISFFSILLGFPTYAIGLSFTNLIDMSN